MRKRGFTLIELLAVIVILAVIALIATPMILGIIESSRNGARKESIAGYAHTVDLIYMKSSMHPLDQSIVDQADKEYKGEKVTCQNVYYHSSGVVLNRCQVGGSEKQYCYAKSKHYTCSSPEYEVLLKEAKEQNKPVNECRFEGELIQGAEYINGSYTYRYMQQGSNNGWTNLTVSGFGVQLTDLDSSSPVTAKLCTSINGYPIVSMSYMFYKSQAASIDLSSFDTSKVTNMGAMFYEA